MDHVLVLVLAGFIIGSLGTLIGAGGGFLLVPLLILTHPQFSPELITAISMAVVASNAVSGTLAYARLGRIDYRAGVVFAAFTIPGSILGVYLTQYIPLHWFHLVFGGLLILLGVALFRNPPERVNMRDPDLTLRRWKKQSILDKKGITFTYIYNQTAGILISIAVGFISPLLGIGGGIIHVPFMVRVLRFPVYIATATSHFILAIMATCSVMIHVRNGNYADPAVLRMVACLCGGALIGAQVGARLSHGIKGNTIIRVLAICLALVGVRILLMR